MSHPHIHRADAATQNQGNVIGDRSCVRQSKLFRVHESGNCMKGLLGSDHLSWRTDVTEGAYAGKKTFDHMDVRPPHQQHQQYQQYQQYREESSDDQCEVPRYPTNQPSTTMTLRHSSESQTHTQSQSQSHPTHSHIRNRTSNTRNSDTGSMRNDPHLPLSHPLTHLPLSHPPSHLPLSHPPTPTRTDPHLRALAEQRVMAAVAAAASRAAVDPPLHSRTSEQQPRQRTQYASTRPW
jgi:hypothetical protein